MSAPAESLHASCAACDLEAAERWLAKDPSLVHAREPEKGWTPLESLAASPCFRTDAAHARASVEIGRRLLAHGADPNTFWLFDSNDPGSKLPVLFWASQAGNAGLVRLLLEHGARPNDGESVYHAAEHDHREVLELLLAHGAEISAARPPWGNTVLHFLAGFGATHPHAGTVRRGMEWLLEHGADPNEPSGESHETPLHRLVHSGHGAETLNLLLAHGADPRRTRADGRTPYELAMASGNQEAADLLRAPGAAVELRPEDVFHHACAMGDEEGVRRALAAHDLDLGREAPEGGTALHHMAWHGRVAIVRALLGAGAPLDPRDKAFGCSPLAWAAHGSANCRQADADYVAIVDLLLDAGARREPSINHWSQPPENLASPAVATHLRARGFAPAEPA